MLPRHMQVPGLYMAPRTALFTLSLVYLSPGVASAWGVVCVRTVFLVQNELGGVRTWLPGRYQHITVIKCMWSSKTTLCFDYSLFFIIVSVGEAFPALPKVDRGGSTSTMKAGTIYFLLANLPVLLSSCSKLSNQLYNLASL